MYRLHVIAEKIRQTIKIHEDALSKNEMMTRYALIDPVLRELGWDVSDPAAVVPEDRGTNNTTDYTLCDEIIIEAKRLNERLGRHEDKLLKDYSRRAVSIWS